MSPTKRRVAVICLAAFAASSTSCILWAQSAADLPSTADNATAGDFGDVTQLALEQQQVAEKFSRFEDVLLRMAELTAASDPRRAALLKKAVALSKERLIDVQFDTLVDLIEGDRLSRAIENQDGVRKDLESLLELLLSENRADRIQSEKARIRSYLKELNEIIKRQKGIQGRTAGSGDAQRLAGEQGSLAEKTGELGRQIEANEDSEGRPAVSGEPKSQDGNGEGDAQDQSKEQGSSGGEGGRPSPGQGQEGGQGGQGQQPSDRNQPPDQDRQSPQQRIQAAGERMREAEKKLEEAQREGAVEKQEEAIRELEQAKAELEEILRQLREEEIARMLMLLAERFRQMLQMQQGVYDGTVRLDAVPEDRRDHNHQIEASRLSSREAEIVLEADKALALLREDGSAVAFPEAVGQVRQDMEHVAQRLARAKVGQITQLIEEDIIAALEEMIEALDKALEEAEQRQQSQDQPPGRPQDPPLVDLLAEVKMIRALQMRVNRRTEQYSKLIEGEQADSADLLEALARLAEQQQRVHQVTRDLELGKNQ